MTCRALKARWIPVALIALLALAAPTYADLRAPGGRYDEFDVLVPRPLIEPLAHALHLTPETRPLLDACYDRYLVAMLAIETSLDRAAQALEADLATVGVRLPPREGFFMPSPWTDEQRAACNRLLPRMNVERVTHLRQADAALDAFL
ncbi:MAG: hypothetical protein KDA25_09875, partial [Phycisphaerales bacterium]|nr:hypothetical protein [Phycisphaerales bacterium]